jgi:hypothetical protein
MSERFIRLPDLKNHGVPWFRAHAYREIKFGRFPKLVKRSAPKRCRALLWPVSR